MNQTWQKTLEQIDSYRWRIPLSYRKGMLVPGLIYASPLLIEDIKKDKALEQVAAVAALPGIVNASLAMPDIHWGYGFCIGAVAATDPENDGVISPGGVGFDINCGVRLLKTELTRQELLPKLEKIMTELHRTIPAGVGSDGAFTFTAQELKKVVCGGIQWAINHGIGTQNDQEFCEEHGTLSDTETLCVSAKAFERGRKQLGSLGSGNHFIEIQVVDEIYNLEAARIMGLFPQQITVMIHSGSRGFGHQICEDYLETMLIERNQNQKLTDRQLVNAPVNSPIAQNYIKAMNSAANYAWLNRHMLAHQIRLCFEKLFSRQTARQMDLLYDVAHNIAKFETYLIQNKKKKLCVHRKGATRALGPGNKELPLLYQQTGQPVLIPGDMARPSFVLVGTKQAEEETFSSVCHGAGRLHSRHDSIKHTNVKKLLEELALKGIQIKATGQKTIAEEAPYAYKDAEAVVETVENAGLAKKICRLKPVGVLKG